MKDDAESRARSEFANYKRHSLRAARELGYGKDLIELLQKADDEAAIETIMTTGRKRMKDL